MNNFKNDLHKLLFRLVVETSSFVALYVLVSSALSQSKMDPVPVFMLCHVSE
jgi:hypothetical protein